MHIGKIVVVRAFTNSGPKLKLKRMNFTGSENRTGF